METHSISWLWIGDTVLQVILAVLNGKTACKEQSLGVQALVRPRGGTRVSMHARNTSDGFSLHLILNSEILHCCQNFPKPDLQLRGPVWGHRLEARLCPVFYLWSCILQIYLFSFLLFVSSLKHVFIYLLLCGGGVWAQFTKVPCLLRWVPKSTSAHQVWHWVPFSVTIFYFGDMVCLAV